MDVERKGLNADLDALIKERERLARAIDRNATGGSYDHNLERDYNADLIRIEDELAELQEGLERSG